MTLTCSAPIAPAAWAAATVGQQRGQRFTGHRGARCQLVGVIQSSAGLAAADAPPVGQHVGPGLAAQLDGRNGEFG